jgi:hypothetical protein
MHIQAFAEKRKEFCRRTVPFDFATGPANETKTVGPEVAAR